MQHALVMLLNGGRALRVPAEAAGRWLVGQTWKKVHNRPPTGPKRSILIHVPHHNFLFCVLDRFISQLCRALAILADRKDCEGCSARSIRESDLNKNQLFARTTQ